MISKLPLFMLYCFACTAAIECAAALILGIRGKKNFLLIILVNIVTNPVVVSISFFMRIYAGRGGYYISLLILEALALSAEGLIYRFSLKSKLNPFLLSLILNGASFFIGELINKIIF